VKPGPLVLLYPKWIPSNTAQQPRGCIAGPKDHGPTASGFPFLAARPAEMYALNLNVPAARSSRVPNLNSQFPVAGIRRPFRPGRGGNGQNCSRSSGNQSCALSGRAFVPTGDGASFRGRPTPGLWLRQRRWSVSGADGGHPTLFDPVSSGNAGGPPLSPARNFKRIASRRGHHPSIWISFRSYPIISRHPRSNCSSNNTGPGQEPAARCSEASLVPALRFSL